jgi:hypothetical protein
MSVTQQHHDRGGPNPQAWARAPSDQEHQAVLRRLYHESPANATCASRARPLYRPPLWKLPGSCLVPRAHLLPLRVPIAIPVRKRGSGRSPHRVNTMVKACSANLVAQQLPAARRRRTPAAPRGSDRCKTFGVAVSPARSKPPKPGDPAASRSAALFQQPWPGPAGVRLPCTNSSGQRERVPRALPSHQMGTNSTDSRMP